MTVLVFGLVPAWRVSGANPGQVMNMQGTRAVSGRGSARFRATLTTAQIAFSMVLLVLAGLFTRSLSNISREDLGVDVDSIVNFGVTAQLELVRPGGARWFSTIDSRRRWPRNRA